MAVVTRKIIPATVRESVTFYCTTCGCRVKDEPKCSKQAKGIMHGPISTTQPVVQVETYHFLIGQPFPLPVTVEVPE